MVVKQGIWVLHHLVFSPLEQANVGMKLNPHRSSLSSCRLNINLCPMLIPLPEHRPPMAGVKCEGMVSPIEISGKLMFQARQYPNVI